MRVSVSKLLIYRYSINLGVIEIENINLFYTKFVLGLEFLADCNDLGEYTAITIVMKYLSKENALKQQKTIVFLKMFYNKQFDA